jgi:hypothetical protein
MEFFKVVVGEDGRRDCGVDGRDEDAACMLVWKMMMDFRK